MRRRIHNGDVVKFCGPAALKNAIEEARDLHVCESAIIRVLGYQWPQGIDLSVIAKDHWLKMICDSASDIAIATRKTTISRLPRHIHDTRTL